MKKKKSKNGSPKSPKDHLIERVNMDRQSYELAQKYLLGLPGISQQLVDKHIYYQQKMRPRTLNEVYKRFLESAQNAGMRSVVIGKSIGGIDALSEVLCGFDPKDILKKYNDNWEKVLNTIIKDVKPSGKIRQTSRSLWPQFSKTIISAAKFLAQFKNEMDFYRWINFFDKNALARPALPMLLSYEIEGFGFPLACDFVKEIGYTNFGKPDVHLKKIFSKLNLCKRVDDYDVFKAIVRVADNAGVSPYTVDKLFWLIGSGYFYLDNIKVGRHADRFIEYVRISGSII